MTTRPYLRVVGWLAIVSLCSACLGAVVALRLQNERLARTVEARALVADRADHLRRILRLSPEQEREIAVLLAKREKQIRAIAADAGEKAARVGRELEDEIRVRLDPEQVRRFNRLQEVRQLQRERVKQGERPAPGQLERWRERQRPSIVAPEPGEAKSP